MFGWAQRERMEMREENVIFYYFFDRSEKGE